MLLLLDFLYCFVKLYAVSELPAVVCLIYPIVINFFVFKWNSTMRYSSAPYEVLQILKSVLYHSFEVSYFCGFLPLRFVPFDTKIYVDTYSTMLLTVCVWVNSAAMLSSHLIARRAAELRH